MGFRWILKPNIPLLQYSISFSFDRLDGDHVGRARLLER
jgi:hypothetical protein